MSAFNLIQSEVALQSSFFQFPFSVPELVVVQVIGEPHRELTSCKLTLLFPPDWLST